MENNNNIKLTTFIGPNYGKDPVNDLLFIQNSYFAMNDIKTKKTHAALEEDTVKPNPINELLVNCSELINAIKSRLKNKDYQNFSEYFNMENDLHELMKYSEQLLNLTGQELKELEEKNIAK